MPTRDIRLLLVEDHVMVRQGLITALRCFPNIEVVGEASNGQEAVWMVDRLQPTVVVMDITLPKMDGVAATREIKKTHPNLPVLGLSANAEGFDATALRRAGALQVIAKEKAVEELYSEILKAAQPLEPSPAP